MKSPRVTLALIAPVVGALAGCNALESVTATKVVAGTLVRTPELQIQGQFDVQPEILASAYVGERASATDTSEPTPIQGADVAVTFSGNRISLAEQSTAGLYSVTTLDADGAGLLYMEGQSYTFRASENDGSSAEYGGTVVAPTPISAAALTLSPQPTESFPGLPDVLVHAKATDLNVEWGGTQFGRYAYVTVLRADPNDLSNPQQVFDNSPQTAGETISFILGTPPTSITIPGDTFSEDGIYAVIVVTMDKHSSLLPNTFLGSPILAGSGAAIALAVGAP